MRLAPLLLPLLTLPTVAWAAPAPTGWGANARLDLRSPIFDGADPTPYTGPGRPLGSGRLDIMPGLVATTAAGWELGGSLRWSPHIVGLASGALAFAQRGAVELDARRFVPPDDYRTASGVWEGGYAGISAMAELWGRRPPGSFTVGSTHLFVGYRTMIDNRSAAWLEVGFGLWGDRSGDPATGTDPTGGGGPLIRAGVGMMPALARR